MASAVAARTRSAAVWLEFVPPYGYLPLVPWERAQQSALATSRSVAESLAARLQQQSQPLPVIVATAPLRPLNNVLGAAIAIEIAPPPNGAAPDQLSANAYQQQLAAALAAALADVQRATSASALRTRAAEGTP